MIVNMGRHHPSMHGVLHLIVTPDGEDVDCEPILGYLHKGMGKIAKNQTIIQYLPYVTQVITLNGSKKLGSIQVPKKASYIRVIMLELSLYDLLEAATGMGMMHNYFHIGGVVTDLPFEQVEGIGIIGGEEEINWSLSSPILQASRIKWDFQKVYHYDCYDKFDLEIQWQKRRFISSLFSLIKKPSRTFELLRQELNARMEAPKGELGIFLIRDQSGFPWRWKIRSLSFINLQIIPHLFKRMKLVDIMTILGSINIIMGELDH
uniref:NADH-quinone oxidoreductase subunit D domain-containing protein n=1 Tax=Gossypium raimondii TaxID=29730 RepID=A0A0D2MXB8_GOSRA|nr:hypothetical protein B456_004G123700 [Gossypium raimondii]